jgi:hypothetical protein
MAAWLDGLVAARDFGAQPAKKLTMASGVPVVKGNTTRGATVQIGTTSH